MAEAWLRLAPLALSAVAGGLLYGGLWFRRRAARLSLPPTWSASAYDARRKLDALAQVIAERSRLLA
jgi:hypothetical protein